MLVRKRTSSDRREAAAIRTTSPTSIPSAARVLMKVTARDTTGSGELKIRVDSRSATSPGRHAFTAARGGAGTAQHLVQHRRGVETDGLAVQHDAGKSRGGKLAEDVLVVHAEDRQSLGHGDARAMGELGGAKAVVSLQAKSAAGCSSPERKPASAAGLPAGSPTRRGR